MQLPSNIIFYVTFESNSCQDVFVIPIDVLSLIPNIYVVAFMFPIDIHEPGRVSGLLLL